MRRFVVSDTPCIMSNYIVFSLCVSLIFSIISCSQYMDYKENQRREYFDKNFEAFAKLEKMQLEDIRLVGHVSINRDLGYLSEARLSEYRKLMKQAGLEYFGHVSDEPKKEW